MNVRIIQRGISRDSSIWLIFTYLRQFSTLTLVVLSVFRKMQVGRVMLISSFYILHFRKNLQLPYFWTKLDISFFIGQHLVHKLSSNKIRIFWSATVKFNIMPFYTLFSKKILPLCVCAVIRISSGTKLINLKSSTRFHRKLRH